MLKHYSFRYGSWLAFIRFSAFLYLSALMFGHLFKIKDFEFLIPSLATIYLLIGIIPEYTILTLALVIQSLKSINVAGPSFACYIDYFMVGRTVKRRI